MELICFLQRKLVCELCFAGLEAVACFFSRGSLRAQDSWVQGDRAAEPLSLRSHPLVTLTASPPLAPLV